MFTAELGHGNAILSLLQNRQNLAVRKSGRFHAKSPAALFSEILLINATFFWGDYRCSCLIEAVKGKKFALDIAFAQHVHDIVGREEALQWGVLRSRQVGIHGVEHVPPKADELSALAEKGFALLRERIADPIERAIATFLFMSRTQFFFDCNKRTASLMMNGVLLSEGYYPVTVLKETAEEFNKKLRAFYNSGDATEMFKYFKLICSMLYAS